MNKPNIIFICSDQQGAFAMSNSGNSWLKTPNLDMLAASGVNFRRSYCTFPLCTPARASHFTGYMPYQIGVQSNGLNMNIDLEKTMGNLFRNAGYETVWAGKWHLPEWYPKEENTVPGFRCVDYHDGPDDETIDRLYTDEAVKFLDGKHEKPFLLSVQLHNPHNICWNFHYELPPNDFFPEDDSQLPPIENFAVPNEPEAIKKLRLYEMKELKTVHKWDEIDWRTYNYLDKQYWENMDQEAGEILFQMRNARWNETDWRKYRYVYFRLVEKMDLQVGRILNAVKENKLEENTIIIFTSDHGEGAGAHRWSRKQVFYEECVKVPMMISWKNVIPEGMEDKNHLVSGLDLLPTICDYAGIKLDDNVPGRSMRPWIENPQIEGRDYAVAETYAAQGRVVGRMIVNHDYKYMVFDKDGNPEMLFDLKKDPDEKNNVANDQAYSKIKEDLIKNLKKWCKKTDDSINIE